MLGNRTKGYFMLRQQKTTTRCLKAGWSFRVCYRWLTFHSGEWRKIRSSTSPAGSAGTVAGVTVVIHSSMAGSLSAQLQVLKIHI